jgi:hypothetical protein
MLNKFKIQQMTLNLLNLHTKEGLKLFLQNTKLINLSKKKKLVHPIHPPMNTRPRGMAKKGSKTKRTKLVLDMNHFILKSCPSVTCQVYQNVNTPTNPPQNITL